MNKLISKIAVLGVSFGMAAAVGVVVGANRQTDRFTPVIADDGTEHVIADFTGKDEEVIINNGTTPDPISITNPGYSVKQVIIGWQHNKTNDGVTATVTVGDETLGTGKVGGQKTTTTTTIGDGETSLEGNINITWTNGMTGTGKGTLVLKSLTLVEGGASKAVTRVLSVASSPDSVTQNKSIDPNSVMLNVEFDDSTSGQAKASRVTCDTSTVGPTTATAYYDDATTAENSAEFNITVTEPNPSYTLVSSIDGLSNGDDVIVAYTEGSKAMDPNIGTNKYAAAVDVEISEGEITSSEETDALALKLIIDNDKYYFMNGEDYLGSNSGKDLVYSSATSATNAWSVSVSAGVAELEDSFGNLLVYNNASPRFKTYASTFADRRDVKLFAKAGVAPTPKTVTSVDSVATHPDTVSLNSTIAASSVTLNVTYSDESQGTVAATSVTCDTSSIGQKTATAYYNEIGSATFQVEVVKVNPIQELYSKESGYAVADLKGYYVGALDDKTIVVMDGEYGIAVYNKDGIPVSSYTEGETIVTVSGSIYIYNGLYEISGATVAASSSTIVDKPVTYITKGGETAEYASRLTNVTGVPALHEGSSWGTAGASDIKLDFTVGSDTVLVFYKSTRQNATDYAALKAASEAGQEITVKGFTDWFKGFQVAMNGLVSEKPDYTAEQFATELLEATNAKCATYVDGSSSFEEFKEFFQDVWSTLNAKYVTLPAAQKDVLANAQASETGDTIQKAMARYDFLTGKYGLSEFINGRVIDYSIYAGMPEISRGGVAGYVIVISIGTASALAIGLTLILKKKKHSK